MRIVVAGAIDNFGDLTHLEECGCGSDWHLQTSALGPGEDA